MRGLRDRRRSGIMLGVVLRLVLTPGRADALDPTLDIAQYGHTAWRIRDGFYKGIIHAMAQTPDGYLWLGTDSGLVRFDGVQAVPWQSPGNEDLPDRRIQSLLASRDGGLWIGTAGGLASWRHGRLVRYRALAGQDVRTLLEDREGTVWVGVVAPPTGSLCEIRSGSVRCYGEDGRLGHGVRSLYQDSAGTLWVGAEQRLWRWSPGPPQQFPMPGWVNSLSGDENGALLISMRVGMRTLVGSTVEAYPLPDSWIPDRLFRDRDGGLWVVMQTGLARIHRGNIDVFTPADGLSGPNVSALFEDREGNIWVATTDGLDRFRAQAVVAMSARQGMADPNHVASVLGARDGSVWVGNFVGVSRWNRGRVTIYRDKDSAQARELVVKAGSLHEVAGSGLPSGGAQGLFEDHRGRIWVSAAGGVAYLENGRFTRVPGVTGGASSMAEDAAFNLWISNSDGLFRLRNTSVVEEIPWASLGRKDFAVSLTADLVHGGLWLGFSKGGVAYLNNARIGASYTDVDGLGTGRVNGLSVDPQGVLWAATQGGLSRITDGHIATLRREHGLPCNQVDWMIEDDRHAVWLNMDCALVRISRVELDSWVEDARRTIDTMVFDSSDGVRSRAYYGDGSPRVGKAGDGRIWFSTFDGLSVVDPHHLPVNELPPPVHVEQIIADQKAYDGSPGVRLPPRTSQIEIHYTALSFVAPEKVRFRIKLEGVDDEWRDVGTRRQAFYTTLPPGSYRFRVMASNNSGLWNEQGASVAFTVAPAYYQTLWFRALVVAVFVGALWTTHRLHVVRLARELQLTFDARLAERTRLARELHDTLLQSSQGLLLKFESVLTILPERPVEARQRLERALDQASKATTEARLAIQGLRASTADTTDLAEFLADVGEEVTAGAVDAPVVHVTVEGTPRTVNPPVRDEIYRIASEALRNAVRHARARHVTAEIGYGRRQFWLVVRDDGTGIDEQALRRRAAEGHFGLETMQERGDAIGGRVRVWSRAGLGTHVELTIPAAIAYAAATELSRPRDVQIRAGRDDAAG